MKKILCLALIALVTVATLNLPAAARPSQSADEMLTPEERREAISLARRFVKRLGETRDIAPLIEEFFVSDFSPRDSTLFLEEVAPDAIDALSREELLRCYAAEFNLGYLILLYILSIDRHALSNGTALEEIFPPELSEQIARDPEMASALGEAQSEETSQSETKPRIRSVEQIRKTMSWMEKAVNLMQGYMTNNPPEQSPFFNENFKQASKDLKAFKPALLSDEDIADLLPAGILPAGARVAGIGIPFVALILTHSDGKLKIFRTMFIRSSC